MKLYARRYSIIWYIYKEPNPYAKYECDSMQEVATKILEETKDWAVFIIKNRHDHLHDYFAKTMPYDHNFSMKDIMQACWLSIDCVHYDQSEIYYFTKKHKDDKATDQTELFKKTFREYYPDVHI